MRSSARSRPAAARGPDGEDWDPSAPSDDGNPLGTAEAELHLAVDVSAFVHLKHRAIACHASQVSDAGHFAAMGDEQFAAAFSTEWHLHPGASPGLRHGWLLDGVGGTSM